MFSQASKLLTACGLHSKCWFSGPFKIQGTCEMTLHLEGVHICHILKYWLRKLYRYSLSAKKWDENFGQNGLSRRNLHGQSRQPCRSGAMWQGKPQGPSAFCALEVSTIECCQLELRGEWTLLMCHLLFWYPFLGASEGQHLVVIILVY